MNDTPVACQTRGPTDPQGDRWRAAPDEGSFVPAAADNFAPRRERIIVSDGPISSNSGRNGGKNAGRNCVSALPQRAAPNSDFPHLPADMARCHRCRSKGLCLRPPARRLPRPLAPATVGVFRSYRRTPQAFPLGGRWRAAPDEGSFVPRPARRRKTDFPL